MPGLFPVKQAAGEDCMWRSCLEHGTLFPQQGVDADLSQGALWRGLCEGRIASLFDQYLFINIAALMSSEEFLGSKHSYFL